MSTSPYAFAGPPPRLVAGWARRGAVGIVSPSYGTEKVSYGLKPPGHSFHKLLRVPVQRFEKRGTFWAHTPIVLDHPVELVHSFNDLPIGVRPFVVSFENELPRYLGEPKPWQMERGHEMLASDRCRRILALSDAAAAAMRMRLRQRGLESLMDKVTVFRGTVLSVPESDGTRREPATGRPLKVLFVGRDAFGKGLLPTLDALDDCRAQGADIEATIVCNFEPRHYISKGWPIDDKALVARMQAMPGITWHAQLPNREIHRLMRLNDVLLFPTLDESLGWVAVEAAMAGLPVITTDIFAIPELVRDGQTGVTIPLHKNELARWVGLWLGGAEFEQEVASTFATMRTHIGRALLRFADNPGLAASMGDAAREHIESLYGFSRVQRQLADIYAAALDRA